MGVMAIPILPGKVDAWKEWIVSLAGNEFEDFNRRYNLTIHRVWLQANPDGSHLAIVLTDGSGADEFVPKLSQSSLAFDGQFREKVKELHGMDITQPPPGPPPEMVLDYST